MRHFSTAVLGSVCALLVHLAEPGVALAQQDAQKTAVAVSLYDEAMKDFNAGKYADACPKLERVTELVPKGIGARFDLGSCYEAQGKLASAFGAFLTAESLAKAEGDKRAADAGARAAALRPKLASLKIDVPAEVKSAPGFTLTRNGVPLTVAEFGLALSVDKGEQVIVVTATGRAPWEKKLSVADGEKPVVTVELGVAGAAPGPGEQTDPPPGDEPLPDPDPKPGTASEGTFMTPLRIAGLIGGIVGVVGVGAGIGVGMAAKGLYDDSNGAEGGCSAETNICSKQAGIDLREDAQGLGTVATGLVIAGAVLGAAGIVVFAVAPSDEGSAASSSDAAFLQDPTFQVGPGSVSFSANF